MDLNQWKVIQANWRIRKIVYYDDLIRSRVGSQARGHCVIDMLGVPASTGNDY